MSSSERHFTVVMRTQSGATFPGRRRFKVTYQSAGGPLVLIFSSLRRDLGLGVETAIYLVIEASGSSVSLDGAIKEFTAIANLACAVIALSTNAAIEPVKVHLAYEKAAPGQVGDFMQRYFRDEQPILLQGRRIDIPSLQAIFPKLGAYPDPKCIFTSIEYYRLALLNWLPRHEFACFNFLWICVEALTPHLLKLELDRLGITNDDLYRNWTLPAPKDAQDFTNKLNGAVRKKLIFHDDTESYKNARSARNGLLHSIIDIDKVMNKIKSVKLKTAQHVRSTIISLLHVTAADINGLLGEHFSKPLGRWEHDFILRTGLSPAADGSLSATPSGHPMFRWEHPIQSLEVGVDDAVSIQLGGNLTAMLADGALFHTSRMRFEVFGPEPEPTSPQSSAELGTQGPLVGAPAHIDTSERLTAEAQKPRLNRVRLAGLMDRILSAAAGAVPKKEFEITRETAVIVKMYWRARSLFDGVASLVRSELADEAWMLAGPIFEESLRIAEFRRLESKRLALALGWLLRDIDHQERLMVLMAVRHDENSDDIVKKLKEHRCNIIEQARSRGALEPIGFLPTAAAAAEFERASDYWLYEVAQEYIRSYQGNEMNRLRSAHGRMEMYGKTSDIEASGAVVEFAGKSLLYAAIDIVAILGSGNSRRCAEVIAEIDALEPPRKHSPQVKT